MSAHPITQGCRGFVVAARLSKEHEHRSKGYHKLGLDVDEILEGLPQLTPAQIYEALSYYHDNPAEIERDIEEGQVERLVERYGLKVLDNGRTRWRIVNPESSLFIRFYCIHWALGGDTLWNSQHGLEAGINLLYR
ncbi:MAG TPA: DUF433 domain-containing protein [Pyrinomonadaceae bacterium]|nr:DUF433 domain-containing protein [Pyrinomonadaceae bacterium]